MFWMVTYYCCWIVVKEMISFYWMITYCCWIVIYGSIVMNDYFLLWLTTCVFMNC